MKKTKTKNFSFRLLPFPFCLLGAVFFFSNRFAHSAYLGLFVSFCSFIHVL